MALRCWPTAAQAMDGDGNGKLDTAEFRAAMSQLGDNLSGDSVGTIFEAMGIYGFITLDQFLGLSCMPFRFGLCSLLMPETFPSPHSSKFTAARR